MTTTSSTSDRDISQEGEKHITALGIARVRKQKSRLTLQKGENITQVSTRHSSYGCLVSLMFKTEINQLILISGYSLMEFEFKNIALFDFI